MRKPHPDPYRAATDAVTAVLAGDELRNHVEGPYEFFDPWVEQEVSERPFRRIHNTPLPTQSELNLLALLCKGPMRENASAFIGTHIEQFGYALDTPAEGKEEFGAIDGRPFLPLRNRDSEWIRAFILEPRVFWPDSSGESPEYLFAEALQQLADQRLRVRGTKVRVDGTEYAVAPPAQELIIGPKAPIMQIALIPGFNGEQNHLLRKVEQTASLLSRLIRATPEIMEGCRCAYWGFGPLSTALWCEPAPLMRRVAGRVGYVCMLSGIST
ncbi:hypothetical protein [Niveibacterium sp. COAC-50]|uniref:hypothetical protein n=1 Tax=Niveibacterium sp. COAC-50 TaxID=2729384 RepID=UPI0015574862|nr:hypothetical protein [Niveibacterium sp. COAC-50]